MPDQFYKRTIEILDYSIDWSAWLDVDGDTILTSDWVAEPSAGISLVTDSNTPKTTTVFVSGGYLLQKYVLHNTITTSKGRTASDHITVTIHKENGSA